jgi:hypothetical protein
MSTRRQQHASALSVHPVPLPAPPTSCDVLVGLIATSDGEK